MKVLVYKIPAEQALRQDVKPKMEGKVIAWNSDGTAVVQYEDLTLDCVDVRKLQSAPADAPSAVAKAIGNKK
jgi:hypothetical protein